MPPTWTEGEPEAGGRLPEDPARGLGWPLLLWAVGSVLAVLAVEAGLRTGIGLAILAGAVFGWASARWARGPAPATG